MLIDYNLEAFMKQILLSAAAPVLFALPFIVSAQQGIADGGTGGGDFGDFLVTLLEFANTVLIPFIIGIGFLVFVFGLFQYFILGGANDEKKEKGRSLMIYAILAFVLIVVFWGLINLLASSIGLEGERLENRPSVGVDIGVPD